jgi:hypothetical protein
MGKDSTKDGGPKTNRILMGLVVSKKYVITSVAILHNVPFTSYF